MEQVQAIIFDLDGTLVNSIADLGLCVHYALKKSGFQSSASPEDYLPMVGNGTKKLVERAMQQYQVPFEEFPRIFAFFQDFYEVHALDHTVAYTGMGEVLKKLKESGLYLAVHTNKPDAIAKKIVSRIFPGCFDCICGQREDFPLKPNPRVSEDIMMQFGVARTHCIFCGDSNVDIQTAQNAGMLSIGVTWGFRSESELRKAGADFIACQPKDIEKIVCGY